MSVEGQRCLCIVVLLIHTVRGAGEETHKDATIWLKNNSDPWEDVISRWKSTYDLRHLLEYDTVGGFIEKWPILNDVRSCVLINLDFEAMHSGKENKFYLNWKNFLNKVTALRKTSAKEETAELTTHIEALLDDGPTPSPSPLPSPSTLKAEHNELTVTFPPLDDIYANTPEKHFGTENNTVVTSQTGSTALLPCVIRNIGDGIVSWIRRKDYHLLTVGLTTYSSDQRFQAIHLQHSEDWTLKVRFVQKRDAGIYECQVSSHPPTSIFLRLDVVEARAQISGPTEKYLKPGSTLRLQCSVVQTTEAPAFVFWYHNSRMINYDVEHGINVTTDPAQRLSDLLIPATSVSHAGNYTCVPNNAVPASIYVHIFNGENPAAMQSSSPGYSRLKFHGFLLTVLTTLNLVLR